MASPAYSSNPGSRVSRSMFMKRCAAWEHMSTRSMALVPGGGRSTFDTSMGQSSLLSGRMRSTLL
eukprot:14606342-Heterocapsa_arctica.AAC.1